MLRDILHKCRHILDYHSNESFNCLSVAEAGERQHFQRGAEGRGNSGSLHKMAKEEK